MKFRLLVPIILLVVLIVAACGSPPPLRSDLYLVDDSLISGDPCEAPCWRGIVPGETSWRDAVIIIEDDSQLVNIQTQEAEDADAIAITWEARDKGQVCCQMYSEDGNMVNAVILLVTPDLRLGAVLDSLGEPLYIAGNTVAEDQALMTLFYPEIPVIVAAFVEGAETGVLSESSEIVNIVYLSQGDMQDILETSSLYNWNGYGTYAEYVDGNFDLTPEVAEATEEAS